MTVGTMDAAIRAKGLAFCGPGIERLVDAQARYASGDMMAHPSYCNKRFCGVCVTVADANALTETQLATVLRAWIDTGDASAWRALLAGV